jgi:dTMP kinase
MNLIVIEGLDGAGKSTQIEYLQEFFKTKNIPCKYLHFPRTDNPYFGELIARFLRGEYGKLTEVDPYLVAMLYAGDRKDAADEIFEWIDNGSFVLLDRYVYSNIAYQGAKINDPDERIKLKRWILELEYDHFKIPVPALNLFLDVPISFTESQLKNDRSGSDRDYLNGNQDIHESSLNFQKKVREVYIEAALTDTTLEVVNCIDKKGVMRSAEAIFGMILQILIMKKIVG